MKRNNINILNELECSSLTLHSNLLYIDQNNSRGSLYHADLNSSVSRRLEDVERKMDKKNISLRYCIIGLMSKASKIFSPN